MREQVPTRVPDRSVVRREEGLTPAESSKPAVRLRLLRSVGVSLACALAIAFGAVAQGPIPDDPLLFWRQATLYRDEWGTPHVFADTPRAAAFAFGYAQADDHLEPMMMAYRIANGRAAEVLGEELAASDEFSLKMGYAERAAKALEDADMLTRDLCEGFALGVNAWLVDHPDRVPPWVDGARPADVLALLQCYLMSMAPFDLPDEYARPPASQSGNAWAIAPGRTDEGKPILVINPHEPYEGPFRWYEAHMVVGSMGLNVAGATLFGLPVILQGHNPVLGWAMTPNEPDFADVYIEGVPELPHNPKVPNQPAFDEERALVAALLENSKRYFVQTPAGPQERAVPSLDTPRGPVIGRFHGKFCSYSVGGYDRFGALAQCIEMGRATSLADFQAAVTMQQFPCFHMVYADREGNLFYLYNARIAEKAESGAQGDPATRIEWNMPVRADEAGLHRGAWIEPQALPALVNPESGYVQACGNPPWTATTNCPLKADEWPAWLVHDPDTYRAKRVRQLLDMGRRSFRDSQSMLFDVLVPFAVDAVPWLLDIAEKNEDFVTHAHPDIIDALETLRTWNCVAETNAPGMTLFNLWWNSMLDLDPVAFQSEGSLYVAIEENSPAIQRLALEALAQAVRLLRNEFHELSVEWGDVHVIRRGERQEPCFGGHAGQPIFVTSTRGFDHGVWPVDYGYGFAMVVEFGEYPRAVSLQPFGASEVAGTPHFDDQLTLMLERRFKLTRFLDADVQRNTVSAIGRMIALRPKGMDAFFTLEAPRPVEARLYTSLDAPEPLPEGMAAFSVYCGVEYVPRDTPVALHITVTIPEALCAAADLEKLAVYAYNPDGGWTLLEGSMPPRDERTFFADDQNAHVYAVLGPEASRKLDTTPELDTPPPPPPKPHEAAKRKQGQIEIIEERPGATIRGNIRGAPTDPAIRPLDLDGPDEVDPDQQPRERKNRDESPQPQRKNVRKNFTFRRGS